MDTIQKYVGAQIRKYRKSCKWTIQDLADAIHKSRATVCKYERGEIAIDVGSLYEISQALQISLGQLTDYHPLPPAPEALEPGSGAMSPFFRAKRLYFYFYDGRYSRLKDGIINIREKTGEPGTCEATFTISSVTPGGRSSEAFYTGSVLYSDMLIRFTFVNQYNPLEEDLLYIFNPLEKRDYSDGLLCGISSADLMPCAFRCLVTLRPQALDEQLRQRLLLTPQEMRRWARENMLLVDNRGGSAV